MNLLSSSYYFDRVNTRLVNSRIAAKSLDKFNRTNPKDELAWKNGEKITNFYKNSKDHNLQRARDKNKFMESLIEKHIDKFASPGDKGRQQYYTNYVEYFCIFDLSIVKLRLLSITKKFTTKIRIRTIKITLMN
jgi:hypothetical protein